VSAATAALSDEQVLALTLFGEARGEPMEGMLAVAAVIRNRVKADLGHDGKADWWGEGYRGVCLKDKQFSCWNDGDPTQLAVLEHAATIASPGPKMHLLLWIAQGTVHGYLSDTLFGATHYHATRITPSWIATMIPVAQRGQHIFYRER